MNQPIPYLAPKNDRTAVRRALIVMNPAADKCSPAEIRREVAERLGPAGWHWGIAEVKSVKELDDAAERAAHGEYDVVVVAGGDATVARVARHLVGSDTALGIIPMGRENSIALGLGIPEDSSLAASLLVEDHEVGYLDALRVGDQHFFLQVGTAAGAGKSEASISLPGRGQGQPVNTSHGPASSTFKSRRFSLMVDGRHYRTSGWQVLVVNSAAYGSGVLSAGSPNLPSDGVSDLIVLRVRSARDLLGAGLSFLGLGRVDGKGGVAIAFHRVRDRVVVAPDEPALLEGDGELIGTTPSEIRVVPRAVRVVIPRGASSRGAAVPAFPAVKEVRGWRRGRLRSALLKRLSPAGVVDTALFMAVADLPHPRLLNVFMQSLEFGMASGRGWIAGTLVVDIVRGRRPWADLLHLAPPLLLATATTEFPIKAVAARPRPFVTLMLTSVVGRRPSSLSFPSGHSASAFGGAWLLSRRHPRWAPAFYAFASLVAFSRVYQGHHYPSDVAIGAVAGMALAGAYRWTLGRVLPRMW